MLMKMVAIGINKYCSVASQNGHLECLKYTRENGCEFFQFEMIKNLI